MLKKFFSLEEMSKGKSKFKYICILIMALLFAGCNKTTETTFDSSIETEAFAGFIVIEENNLIVDIVEVITVEDKNRIAELGLKLEDMPNGYIVYNITVGEDIYELTDETTYTFTDIQLLFVEDPDSDRIYTTTDKEQFIEHLRASYNDIPPASNVPFFIEVRDGKVLSIEEKLIFTQ